MNKKYHFVKVGLVNDSTYQGTWYFKPETKEDVDEHQNKYVACEINDGVKEYVDRLKAHAKGLCMGHSTTEWGSLMDILTSATGQPNIVRLMKAEKEGKNKKETCDNSHCEKVNESKKNVGITVTMNCKKCKNG